MKILVADDDLFFRQILESMLSDWGYEVVPACNGAEAWQILQENNAPRLALIDWVMPELDGIEVVRRARACPSPQPVYVIMLTTRAKRENIIEALEAGANDYLSKPFDHNELLARLHVGERVTHLQNQQARNLWALQEKERKLLSLNSELETKIAERTALLQEANERLEEELDRRSQTEEALRRAMLGAEAACRLKTEILANVNHEIRTPLNHIIGFANVLADEMLGPLNAQQQEYVKNIVAGGKRLFELLVNILDVADVDSGGSTLNVSTFPIKEFIAPLINLFSFDAKARNIELSFALDPSAEIEVRGDPAKLQKIICQLLSNALKFTPDGGRVSVRGRRVHGSASMALQDPLGPKDSAGPKDPLGPEDPAGPKWFEVRSSDEQTIGDGTLPPATDGDFIEISVEDTGIGIKGDDIPRLFAIFTQLESPYTKRYAGAGLGLAVVRKFVELHGGVIRVKSDVGKGSTFAFTIPVRR